MATFRTTITSTLGTVSTTAEALTKTVSTVAIGVDMAHDWATMERLKQQATNKHELKFVEKEAKIKAASRLAELNMEVARFMAKDQMHHAAYTEALAELEAS